MSTFEDNYNSTIMMTARENLKAAKIETECAEIELEIKKEQLRITKEHGKAEALPPVKLEN